MKRGPITWIKNVLLGIDETGNAILAGDPTHSISARTGYALHRGKRWAKIAAPIIDHLMFDPGHCLEAAEAEGLLPPKS